MVARSRTNIHRALIKDIGGVSLMHSDRNRTAYAVLGLFFAALLGAACTKTVPSEPVKSAHTDLWAHDNLVAWCVVPFDAKSRGPEERAQMLQKLGFRHFAHDGPQDADYARAEIQAIKQHG